VKSLSKKEFASILEKRGWVLKRVHGSRRVYVKEGSPARITFPVHGSKAPKKGLLLHLMKVAGLGEADL